MGYYNNQNRPHRAYRSNGSNYGRNTYGHPRHIENNHSEHSHKDHQTPSQKFLRALVSIFTSIGFALFWYALAIGIDDNMLFFVLGIVLMAIGVIHIFIGIKKDAKHRNNNG